MTCLNYTFFILRGDCILSKIDSGEHCSKIAIRSQLLGRVLSITSQGHKKAFSDIGKRLFCDHSLRFSGVFISFALKRAVPIRVVNIVDTTISNSALIPTDVMRKSIMLLPDLSLSI